MCSRRVQEVSRVTRAQWTDTTMDRHRHNNTHTHTHTHTCCGLEAFPHGSFEQGGGFVDEGWVHGGLLDLQVLDALLGLGLAEPYRLVVG